MRRLMARLTVQTRNDHGVALFAAIAGMVVLSTMIAALVILARNEGLIAQLNKDEAQAAYAAEAGANWGRRVLHRIFQTDLPARVFATPPNAMNAALQTTYRTSVGAAQFIRDFAIPVSGPQFVACSPCPDPMYSAVYSDATTKQITDNLQSVLTLTCPGNSRLPCQHGVHGPGDRKRPPHDPARCHAGHRRGGRIVYLRVADRVEWHRRTRAPAVRHS